MNGRDRLQTYAGLVVVGVAAWLMVSQVGLLHLLALHSPWFLMLELALHPGG